MSWPLVLVSLLLIGSHSFAKADFAEKCEHLVKEVLNRTIQWAEQKQPTIVNATLLFWDCLDEKSLEKDLGAICTFIGQLFPKQNDDGRFMEYFFYKQLDSSCQLCRRNVQKLSEIVNRYDLGSILGTLQRLYKAPNVSPEKLEILGRTLTNQLSVTFNDEFCDENLPFCSPEVNSVENFQFNPTDNFKFNPMDNPVFSNLTHCLECNVCDNVILFAQMKLVPNSNLPHCLTEHVIDKLCDFLGQLGDIGIGDMKALCLSFEKMAVDNIMQLLHTLINSDFVCQSMLSACDGNHSSNILECVCLNVDMPPETEWLIPCRSFRQVSS